MTTALMILCQPTLKPSESGFIAYNDALRVVATGATEEVACGCFWASLVALIEFSREHDAPIAALAGQVDQALALASSLASCPHGVE